MQNIKIKPIAKIHTDFKTKFGIPRQSGLVKNVRGKVIFEPEFRDINAVRGLDEYSYIWLIWGFSENIGRVWKPTVRPPRLGGNKHMGVFATRSPFRPNPLGLSCVKLENIEVNAELGAVIYVSGVDLMNGTPIFDIKPYIPYTDSHFDAVAGFSDCVKGYSLKVDFPAILAENIPKNICKTIIEILENDPTPSYHDDENRIYGLKFAGYEVRFTKKKDKIKVSEIIPPDKVKPVK